MIRLAILFLLSGCAAMPCAKIHQDRELTMRAEGRYVDADREAVEAQHCRSLLAKIHNGDMVDTIHSACAE